MGKLNGGSEGFLLILDPVMNAIIEPVLRTLIYPNWVHNEHRTINTIQLQMCEGGWWTLSRLAVVGPFADSSLSPHRLPLVVIWLFGEELMYFKLMSHKSTRDASAGWLPHHIPLILNRMSFHPANREIFLSPGRFVMWQPLLIHLAPTAAAVHISSQSDYWLQLWGHPLAGLQRTVP